MEEKKEIRISLSTFLLLIAIVIIIVMGIYIYKIETDKESIDINNSTSTVSEIDATETNNQKTDIYAKYENEKLIWFVKERLGNKNIDGEHLIYGEDLSSVYPFLDLKDGKLYFIPSEFTLEKDENGKDVELDSIKGNVKYVFFEYEKQTSAFESFYAITDDGSVWKNKVSYDTNYNSFSLVKKYNENIVDVTIVENGMSSNVYFLLAGGDLLDLNGNEYKID